MIGHLHPFMGAQSEDVHSRFYDNQGNTLDYVYEPDGDTLPPKIQHSNAKHYKSDTVTEVEEFEGPHLMPSQECWEEIADYALDWAVEHARAPVAS